MGLDIGVAKLTLGFLVIYLPYHTSSTCGIFSGTLCSGVVGGLVTDEIRRMAISFEY